jgi:hypothetical protein
LSADKHMTEGDLRAETDRIAKARGPAYADGYQAGLLRAIALIQDAQRVVDPQYGTEMVDVLQVAIDAIGEEVEA